MAKKPEIGGTDYPSHKSFAMEVLGGLDFDSLKVVEAVVGVMDADPADLGTPGLNRRETAMIVLEHGLMTGDEFETTMFGIPVKITPLTVASGQPGTTGDVPPEPGQDEGPTAGDREPRQPLPPHDSGQVYATV